MERLTGKMPLQRRKDCNIQEDKELGLKTSVQKSTEHFSRLPRPFQIFQWKIWGRPCGQIMPMALSGKMRLKNITYHNARNDKQLL